MTIIDEHKQSNSIASTLTTLCSQAETYRNTDTDELVSAVVDDMRKFVGASSHYGEEERNRRIKIYRDMTDYLKRCYDSSLKRNNVVRCSRTLSPAGRVSLDQYNKFACLAETALKTIAEDMSRYKKIKTDLRAYSLIQEINSEIKKLNLATVAYNRSDLKTVYSGKDFRTNVDLYRGKILEYLEVYLRIKAFEVITDYY